MQFVVPPQLVTSSETHDPFEAWKPLLQLASTQLALLHVPVPFGNAVVQLFVGEPQAVSVSASHEAPLAWKPVLQAIPQLPAAQVADPFEGTAHGEHDVPQLCGLESEAHEPVHRCEPELHETSTHVPASELHTPWPPENAAVQSTGGLPQAVSLLFTQAVPLTCWPPGQSQALFTQSVDAQSLPEPQWSVAPQGAQVLPPQSMSVSLPFFFWSMQVGAVAC